ncbi:hypothetical protein [Xenorhabdus szentirmaii]|uniref:Uncharacterized protein n=1 Tax=Xenorhabdus szentirmaii DSM 16338 TaxID=1427518 RepID=W1IU81_9GAMM|nr:hypothetical protein [Xenorhabdus sp. 42]CDL81989.1 hypothetical protein XSR1_180028 [Xenorhabdus szentirmaii DSM 16338]
MPSVYLWHLCYGEGESSKYDDLITRQIQKTWHGSWRAGTALTEERAQKIGQ